MQFVMLILLLISTDCSQSSGQGVYKEREITFQNGPVELSGTFFLPHSKNSVPAIVFLHGSGPQDRSDFRPYAEYFSRLGIASIFYDKRGTGNSGGSWINSSMEDLANDGLAAVQYLKRQKKIDPERIGFWGISQAGWIAPIAASKSSDINFMIIVSGGGASPKVSEYFSYQNIFNHMGLSEKDEKRAFGIIDKYFAYLEFGNGRPELMSILNELEANTDDSLHQLPQYIRVPTIGNRINWKTVATYDPIADIRRYRGHLLLLLGDSDTDHPSKIALEKWKEGMQKANNDNGTYVVFQNAGHGIRKGAGHNREAPFADGYLEVQLGWLWKNILN